MISTWFKVIYKFCWCITFCNDTNLLVGQYVLGSKLHCSLWSCVVICSKVCTSWKTCSIILTSQLKMKSAINTNKSISSKYHTLQIGGNSAIASCIANSCSKLRCNTLLTEGWSPQQCADKSILVTKYKYLLYLHGLQQLSRHNPVYKSLPPKVTLKTDHTEN